jgi:hypothetical protein
MKKLSLRSTVLSIQKYARLCHLPLQVNQRSPGSVFLEDAAYTSYKIYELAGQGRSIGKQVKEIGGKGTVLTAMNPSSVLKRHASTGGWNFRFTMIKIWL